MFLRSPSGIIYRKATRDLQQLVKLLYLSEEMDGSNEADRVVTRPL